MAVMLALSLLVLLAAAPSHAAAQQAQTISRAELDAGGWTRLSELVFAIRGVSRMSVDGITVGASVGGLPLWGLASDNGVLAVVIDGQPVSVDLGGAQVLDLLPVSLTQLDSVTFTRAPAVAGGRIAMHGVLHLHTQRGISGLRASASHYSGNEVGDPGPFAFTPRATPNVDNNGPFHRGRLAYGNGSTDVDVAIRRWTDNLTDERLQRRYVPAASPAAPDLWVRHLAPTLRAGIRALGGRHDIHAGVATLDGTYFVPAPRADQSLATQLAFAGVSGTVGAGRGTGATYRFQAAQLESSPYGAPFPATLAHERRAVGGGLELVLTPGSMHVTAGISASHRSLLAAPALGGALPGGEAEVDALFSVDAPGALHPTVAVSIGRGLGGMRAAGVASVSYAMARAGTLTFTGAVSRRALGDDGAWVDLVLLGLDSITASPRTSAAASTSWARRLPGGAVLALGGTVRRETGLRVVIPGATPPDVGGTTSAPASLTSGELRASADLPFGGVVLGGASYRYSAPLGGFDGARDASGMLPRHLLDASVTIVPAFDIRVRPALHLASATHWMAETTYDEAFVPAIARVDLSLEKWLLARRVRLQVLGRNLLNNVERYHPLGADFRLRVFAGVTASF